MEPVATPKRQLTFRIDDVNGGTAAGVWYTLTDFGDGRVQLDIRTEGTDARGAFIDFAESQEGVLAGLKMTDLSGGLLTGSAIGNDSITALKSQSDVNITGEVAKAAGGGMDVVMAIGSAGMATDYVTNFSVMLTSTSGFLSLDSFANAFFGFRGTSTYDPATGALTASTKMGEQLGGGFFDAKDDARTVSEDSTDTFNVFANDVNAAGAVVMQWYKDGVALKGNTYTDPATKTVFTFSADGTVTVNAMDADILTANDAPVFNFSYDAKVTDAKDATTYLQDSANVKITIVGIDNENTAPVLGDIVTEAFGEGRTARIDLRNFVTDDAGDRHTFALVGAPQYTIVNMVPNTTPKFPVIDTSGLLTLDPATGMLTLNADSPAIAVLHDGWTLILTGTYRVTDQGGLEDDASYTFYISGKNSLATRQASVAMDEGTSMSIDLVKAGYVTDPDYLASPRLQQNGLVTFQYFDPEGNIWPQPPFDTSGIRVTLFSGGRLDISATGFLTLPEGARLFAVLNYDAMVIGSATRVPGSVKIDITGLNNLDVSAENISAEGYMPASGQVTVFDPDFDGSATLTAATATLANGKSFALDLYGEDTKVSDGVYLSLFGNSYTMVVTEAAAGLAAGATMPIRLDFTATDNLGKAVTATATATVIGVNDAPVFSPIGAVVDEYGIATRSLAGLVADPDRDAMTLSLEKISAGRIYGASGEFIAELDQDTLQQLLVTVEQRAASDGTIESVLTVDTAKSGAFNFLSQGMRIEVDAILNAADAHGAMSQGTATINIFGANDAAVASGADLRLEGYGTATGMLLIRDPDRYDDSANNIVTAATATLADGTVISLDLAGVKTEVSPGVFVSFNAEDRTYALEVTKAAAGLAAGEKMPIQLNFTVSDGADPAFATTSTVNAVVVGVADAPEFIGNITLGAYENGSSTQFLYGTVRGEFYNPYIADDGNLSLALEGVSEGRVYDINGDMVMTIDQKTMQSMVTLEYRADKVFAGDWLSIADHDYFNFLSGGMRVEATAFLGATDVEGATGHGTAQVSFLGKNDAAIVSGADIRLAGSGFATERLTMTDPDTFDNAANNAVAVILGSFADNTGFYYDPFLGGESEIRTGFFFSFNAADLSYTLRVDEAAAGLGRGEEVPIEISFIVSDLTDAGATSTVTINATAVGVGQNAAPRFIVNPIEASWDENSGMRLFQDEQAYGAGFNMDPEGDAFSVKMEGIMAAEVYDADGNLIEVLDPAILGELLRVEQQDGNWLVASADAANFMSQGTRLDLIASLSATDAYGATEYGEARLTMWGNNDAPSISGPDLTLTGYGTRGGKLALADADQGDMVKLTSVSAILADGKTFSLVSGVLTEVAAGIFVSFNSADNSYALRVTNAAAYLEAGEAFPVQLAFTAADGFGAEAAAIINATAIGTANSAPLWRLADPTLSEDGKLSRTERQFISDPDGDKFTVALHGSSGWDVYNSSGDLVTSLDLSEEELHSLVMVDKANTLTIDPQGSGIFNFLSADMHAVATASFSATDALGATSFRDLHITITGANDTPLLFSDTYDSGNNRLSGAGTIANTLAVADPDIGDFAALSEAYATLADGTVFALSLNGEETEIYEGVFASVNGAADADAGFALRVDESAPGLASGAELAVLMEIAALDQYGGETRSFFDMILFGNAGQIG